MNAHEIANEARRIARDLEGFATLSPVDYAEKVTILRGLRDRLAELADDIEYDSFPGGTVIQHEPPKLR